MAREARFDRSGRLRLDRTREANRLITALSARADALSDTEKEG